MMERYSAIPYPLLNADLPIPYVGNFEQWADGKTGDVHYVLNVFMIVGGARRVFLRCFHAEGAGSAQLEFDDWLMGMYNTALVS